MQKTKKNYARSRKKPLHKDTYTNFLKFATQFFFSDTAI